MTVVARCRLLPLFVAALSTVASAAAQPAEPLRIRELPGYARFAEVGWQIERAATLAAIEPVWSADSASFDYVFAGRRMRFDLATRSATEVQSSLSPAEPNRWGVPSSSDAGAIRVAGTDERRGVVFYVAADGDNYLKQQLHVVRIGGGVDVRLTDAAFNHHVTLSPDRRYFVDVAERHDVPPIARLRSAETGEAIADVAVSDLSRFDALGLRRTEHFSYRAADGMSTLYGSIQRPSNADPSRRYPVLIEVYGGPGTSALTPDERFRLPDPLTEFGFFVVHLTTRLSSSLPAPVPRSIQQMLGQADVDDLAAGIAALREREDVDPDAIGIFGSSYGGYAALMLMLRHPGLAAAASVSSPVTDWRRYDPRFAERYLGKYGDAPEAFERASALTYVDRLEGTLQIYYGTADRNVDPSHSQQLIDALERHGLARLAEIQIGDGNGHSSVGRVAMLTFFTDQLIDRRVAARRFPEVAREGTGRGVQTAPGPVSPAR